MRKMTQTPPTKTARKDKLSATRLAEVANSAFMTFSELRLDAVSRAEMTGGLLGIGVNTSDKEDIVSEHMLHLRSPGRWDDTAAIVGDRLALLALRRAVDMALSTGGGGAFLFSSDGEGYALAVALEENMWNVQTAYADEVAPVRSLREVVPLYAVANFAAALRVAIHERDRFASCGAKDCHHAIVEVPK